MPAHCYCTLVGIVLIVCAHSQSFSLGDVAIVSVDLAGGSFNVTRKMDGAVAFKAAPNFLTIGDGTLHRHDMIFAGALFDEGFETTTIVDGVTTITNVTQESATDVRIVGEIQDSKGANQVRYEFGLHSSDLASISWDVQLMNSSQIKVLSIAVASEKSEEIYGMGMQYSRWNLKGLRFPIVSSEQGIGRGLEPVTYAVNKFGKRQGGSWYTTYSACSSFITSSSTGLIVNTTNIGVADFSAGTVSMFSYYHTAHLNGHILLTNASATSPSRLQSLVSSLTEVTGRMRPLPDWALGGAIVGLEGGQKVVTDRVAQLRLWGVPLAGVWLQDWSGLASYKGGQKRVVWNWQLDVAWYSNWTATVADWKSQGTRVLTVSGLPVQPVQTVF
jgi:hypothetical protein